MDIDWSALVVPLVVALLSVVCIGISIFLFNASGGMTMWVVVFFCTGAFFGLVLFVILFLRVMTKVEDLTESLKKLPTH
jgi:hypothetical protein